MNIWLYYFLSTNTVYLYNYLNTSYIKYASNYTLNYIEYKGNIHNDYYHTIGGNGLNSIIGYIPSGPLGTFVTSPPTLTSAWADGFYEFDIKHHHVIEIVLKTTHDGYSVYLNGPFANLDFFRIKKIQIQFNDTVTNVITNPYWKQCSNGGNHVCIYQDLSSTNTWNIPFFAIKTNGFSTSFSVEHYNIYNNCINCVDFILSACDQYQDVGVADVVSNAPQVSDLYFIYDNTQFINSKAPFVTNNRFMHYDDNLNLFIDTLLIHGVLYFSYVQIYYVHAEYTLVSFPNMNGTSTYTLEMAFSHMTPQIGDTISDFDGRSSFWTGSKWVGGLSHLSRYTGYKLHTSNPTYFMCEGTHNEYLNNINIQRGWSWYPIHQNTTLSQFLPTSMLENNMFPLFSIIMKITDFNNGIISSYFKGSGWTIDATLTSGHAYIIYSKTDIELEHRRSLSTSHITSFGCDHEPTPLYPLGPTFQDSTYLVENVEVCENIYFIQNYKTIGRGIVYLKQNTTYADVILFTNVKRSTLITTSQGQACVVFKSTIRC